ncbi:MAG TPA: NAD(P)-dependent oxidoreductase, partial [Thermomicrobiales bacterium]|nr:NAD(P)-dependent oxidoreductase [Thermomicrobiales bacterium]
IARRLLAAGYPLAVNNRSQASVQELAGLGAAALPDAAAIGAACDVVLTALPTPETVHEVYLGERGLLAGASGDTLLIDLSTVSPALSREIAAAARQRGLEFLDAPISGGPEGAVNGTLTIMCGGDGTAFERARPIFDVFGERIYHAGPSGAGCTIKLVNQLLVSIHAVATAEALALARQAGADSELTFEVVRNAWGNSRIFERSFPLMLAGNDDGGANISIVLKDITVILDLARELGLPLGVGSAAGQALTTARDQGLGARDIAALRLLFPGAAADSD